jgi:hypothetical protein
VTAHAASHLPMLKKNLTLMPPSTLPCYHDSGASNSVVRILRHARRLTSLYHPQATTISVFLEQLDVDSSGKATASPRVGRLFSGPSTTVILSTIVSDAGRSA